MDQNHFTTDTLRKKGAHLTFEERVVIQTRLRDKQSYRSIAREIGCCVNTVRNEVKRGKVLCYNGKVERYRAADGQSTYEAHRENCGRKCDAIAKGAFLDYVQKRLQEHHWSLDWQGTGYGRISTWRDGLYENPVQLCHAGAPRKNQEY